MRSFEFMSMPRQRLTIEKIAKRAKLHPKTVMVLEKTKDCRTLITLKKVADALGKPLKDFV